MIQAWIVHHLEILGEALSHVPQSVRDLAPQLPWSKATGMRNVLVHGYFGIDLDEVWGTADRDLRAASLLSRTRHASSRGTEGKHSMNS